MVLGACARSENQLRTILRPPELIASAKHVRSKVPGEIANSPPPEGTNPTCRSSKSLIFPASREWNAIRSPIGRVGGLCIPPFLVTSGVSRRVEQIELVEIDMKRVAVAWRALPGINNLLPIQCPIEGSHVSIGSRQLLFRTTIDCD